MSRASNVSSTLSDGRSALRNTDGAHESEVSVAVAIAVTV
eukprot:CAMPEP_0198700482 /NCGR_PEP_ID=MMETSP1468-20131203/370669_1 /TAXON_ID=1461545 /ORGANISM="Mantoniella sp, Strain CCMP1436" /LENGTH=39 /DNA_ID= /DNA_START= /DNA_END= /DNA_ORIENTATION=